MSSEAARARGAPWREGLFRAGPGGARPLPGRRRGAGAAGAVGDFGAGHAERRGSGRTGRFCSASPWELALIVADTDVLIDALHGREPAASRIALELRTTSLATTTVSVFELLSGAKSERARRQIERLLGAVSLLGVDDSAAEAAADVRRALEAAGTPIGMADYLIAGICVARSAILLTRNRKHFERVEGLRLGTLEPA
ncbi:MAG: PIN domain-containing protein [Dehalococcoidia bacterium]|nr:PIN domain-containing protein [Dehalococcoidia bacterium]MQA91314.1 PIN domain-containing protein [Gemmatimonas sp.]